MLLIQTQPVLPSNISVVMKVPSTVQKGYARPTKQDVTLPNDVKSKLLDDDLYKNCTNISDVDALNNACAKIAELWEREVLPLVQ